LNPQPFRLVAEYLNQLPNYNIPQTNRRVQEEILGSIKHIEKCYKFVRDKIWELEISNTGNMGSSNNYCRPILTYGGEAWTEVVVSGLTAAEMGFAIVEGTPIKGMVREN
jgi:hypothetical protein